MNNNEHVGVVQYLKNYARQSLEVFKHPLRLLPTFVLGAVWLVIGWLSSVMTLPLPLKIVSFLSYAEGGLFGGVLGALGGIVGKVVMVVFVNSAILPLFQKKLPFVGVAGGIKGMFSSMTHDTARGVAPFLIGLGTALLLYTMMNISQTGLNSMVGIVAAVMLLQNIGQQGGFMFGLLFSIAGSLSKGRTPSYISITRMLTGLAVGFTLSVAMSAIGLHLCFLLGIPILLIGIVLGLLFKTKPKSTFQAKAA
jgi:hypothetical protein